MKRNLLFIFIILLITGCGSKLNAYDRLEKALDNLNDLDSLKSEIKVHAKSKQISFDTKIDLECEKEKDSKKIYFELEVEPKDSDETFIYNTYLTLTEDEVEVYLYSKDELDGWYATALDPDNISLFEYIINDLDMDIFKKVEYVENSNDELVKIEAKVEADELEFDDYEIEKDFEMYFYLDKNNNIVKIEFDVADFLDKFVINEEFIDFETIKYAINISKDDDIKVKIPNYIEEDAIEIEENVFYSFIKVLLGFEEELENENNNSEYDVSMFEEINLDELIELYNDNRKSVIYIGREDCHYCVQFLPMLRQAQREFGYVTYYYDINNITEEEYNEIKDLNDYLNENFGFTPMVLVVQNGEIVSADGSGEGWVGYNQYDNFKSYLESLGF